MFGDQHYDQVAVDLAPGDVLVLYTDGVTEAQNEADEFFGEQGLLMALKHNRKGSAEELRTALLNDVHQFVGRAPQFDDITLMVLQRQV